ncbi:superfamily II DNA/RNA helicase [Clostridium acetobutylicum]|uniref:ATP-dependent RNA helicase, superfamily II n=1 Tax=Clostridium acetobutylicum (strain ATCC 824 / DSM 792 / JCM 1419 / IAM 19013 / LMG 5710 / NBRC 13948 / NRRL B-527 / VKM B-1787 / 2291 / W) TaxID=272562 RepID=Q97KY2_CLOAB|nr:MULTISPECIES: DEAD/DEAH box helicase [Clostridium]AAK78760.1 ATP-dependent RNA helicase, superfamily II [Clostridium acetobutylicum ATCC 824]ADZ19834.1 ATP-dependent RNA helicase, superfamily II [Clostridium acetobutylicum EA 2018]AEI34567.1 ATP-dependent RNA helicase [Clostridium acetobutylicum DSM 1731]AWV80478.1 ATP-dependent helicase [Clostridium acetobutylicum]KHD37469.1 RNA helicase [Clostridium acetobutylicum]
MNFKKLGISEALVEVLKKSGITEPTPVQAESISHIKGGRDVIGEAQTGTGKTLAFLLPIFENISPTLSAVQALIVTPTRELALQITEQALKLKEAKDINILAAYGGKDIASQQKKLRGSTHLIIATPGRLLDLIQRKTVDLRKLKSFVLDEADQMLLMGFKNDVEEILKNAPKKRQMLCFSATISPAVKKLAYRYMTNPLTISTKKKEVTLENIEQFVVETTDRKKLEDLCTALKQDNPFMAIIFGRTKRRVDELEVELYRRGFDCQKLHSDLTQTKRERIMKSFRNGDFQYLLATDVASRGLDISGVSHIYNYDVPDNPESYIHRIGRTGRAGEEGYTCLFAAERDKRKLEDIEAAIKFKIPRRDLTGGKNER